MPTQTYKPTLTDEERETACKLWEALMFAPSGAQLMQARHELKTVSEKVHRAVIHVIAAQWAQKQDPLREDNPFACAAKVPEAGAVDE